MVKLKKLSDHLSFDSKNALKPSNIQQIQVNRSYDSTALRQTYEKKFENEQKIFSK